MKSIISLSSIALISLASAAPAMALTQSSSRTRLVESTMSTPAEPIKLAGFWNKVLDAGIDMVGDEMKRQEAERKAQERRQKQEAAAAARAAEQARRAEERRLAQEKRQAEIAAKRKAEQDYLNSLSPEQREAYIAQKRARQEAQARAMWTIFETFVDMGGSNSSGGTSNNGCPPGTTQRIVNGSWFCT